MGQKENRKIIRIGNSSYAVILPIGWIRYYGLTDSSKVEVITNGIVEIRPLKGGVDG